MRWAGHIVRLVHDRWVPAKMIWYPRSASLRAGRLAIRWAKNMNKQAGNLWKKEREGEIERGTGETN